MAAATAPIFPRTADIQMIEAVLAANTTKDLTAGTSYLIFTADATEGSYLERINVQPKGTNIATVMRIWLNNGATTGTASNNHYLKDFTLPATTNSETAAIGGAELPINIALPATWRVYATLGTAVAGGFAVSGIGGKF